MRQEFNIVGNMFEDFFASMLAYPLTVIQLENQMRKHDPDSRCDVEPGNASPSAPAPPPPYNNVYPMKTMYANEAYRNDAEDLKL